MNSQEVDRVGWMDSAGHRGTTDLLSTCLSTIFLCTWTAVHHDVPKQGQSACRIFLEEGSLDGGRSDCPGIDHDLGTIPVLMRKEVYPLDEATKHSLDD